MPKAIYSKVMREKNTFELRKSAQLYREMSSNTDDFRLKAALLQLAEEFDIEAKHSETSQKASNDK